MKGAICCHLFLSHFCLQNFAFVENCWFCFFLNTCLKEEQFLVVFFFGSHLLSIKFSCLAHGNNELSIFIITVMISAELKLQLGLEAVESLLIDWCVSGFLHSC